MDGLSGAIKFATYEWGKKLVAPVLPSALHAYSHFVCAAGAFLSCSVVMVPGELVKQRLQVGGGKQRPEIGVAVDSTRQGWGGMDMSILYGVPRPPYHPPRFRWAGGRGPEHGGRHQADVENRGAARIFRGLQVSQGNPCMLVSLFPPFAHDQS